MLLANQTQTTVFDLGAPGSLAHANSTRAPLFMLFITLLERRSWKTVTERLGLDVAQTEGALRLESTDWVRFPTSPLCFRTVLTPAFTADCGRRLPSSEGRPIPLFMGRPLLDR